jgi:Transducer of regulated CREB activity, C terminus
VEFFSFDYCCNANRVVGHVMVECCKLCLFCLAADMSTDLTSSGKQTTDVAYVGSAITFNTGDLMSPLVTGVDIFSGLSEAELLTAEDALSLGLDPLAVEELKMLTESASLIDDPDVENSFRQDRAFDIHRQ